MLFRRRTKQALSRIRIRVFLMDEQSSNEVGGGTIRRTNFKQAKEEVV